MRILYICYDGNLDNLGQTQEKDIGLFIKKEVLDLLELDLEKIYYSYKRTWILIFNFPSS